MQLITGLIFVLASALAFLAGGIASSMAKPELNKASRYVVIALGICLSLGLSSIIYKSSGFWYSAIVFIVACSILVFLALRLKADLFYFTVFLVAASTLSENITAIQLSAISVLIQGSSDYVLFIHASKKDKKRLSKKVSSKSLRGQKKIEYDDKTKILRNHNRGKYFSRLIQLVLIPVIIIFIFAIITS